MSPHKENRQAKLVGVLSIAGMLAMVWIVAVFFKSTQQKLGVADTDSSPSPVPMSGDPARMDAADSDISIVRKNPAEKSSDTAEPLVLIADQPNSDPSSQLNTKPTGTAGKAHADTTHESEPEQRADKKIAYEAETVSDVLDDPTVDWQNPEERTLAVARMQAAEEREMAQANALAQKIGAPLSEELADGRTRVLVGLDRHGELLYYYDRNANAAISTAADKVHLSPYSMDGSGVKVGVWENRSPRHTHQEFNESGSSRVNRIDSTTVGSHATHVTGTIAAFGVNSTAKGAAYKTTVDAYTTGGDRSEMTAAAATGPNQHATKIHVSNHSYGYTYGWNGDVWKGDGSDQNAVDELYGQYSWYSREFDLVHYNSPYYLAFWAAGNENTEGRNNGQEAYIPGIEVPLFDEDENDPAKDNRVIYNSAIHPPKDGEYRNGFETVADHTTAKNLVVVGAVTDAVSGGQRDVAVSGKASFSSTGPCDDGRIKPDVVGVGVSVYSTLETSDTAYGEQTGTSMATPNVCGTAALLVDLYRDRFSGGAMRSSTLKGLLIHTATDMGNPGPDYKYGWGLVDAEKAAAHIQYQAANPLLPVIVEDELTPATPTKTADFLWDGSSEIRVTLAWTDPAGSVDSNHDDRTPDLVNDLNLKLIAPDGTTEYFPFVMPFVGTWTVASMNENATTGINNVDNVEQVRVESPGQAGTWQAEISYVGNLTNNVQEFGLHISGTSTDGPLISPSVAEILAVTNPGIDAAPQSFTIQNAGSDTINYTITDDVAWLACSPTSGSSTGEADTIDVTFSTAALPIGTHTGAITITDPGALNNPVTIPVTVIVTATLPYSENFDAVVGSNIPADWSQVFISGAVPWKIQTGGQTGGSRPSTAHSGTKNATLYNDSATPNTVRLITPLINVNQYENLVLTFWHTQQVWSSDQDELKIYYSVDNGGNWVQIAHYTASISSWTQRSLNLPSGNTTMRIAFEGIAKYGYGACVDTVSITGDFVGSVIITESGGSTDVVEGGATDSYTVGLGSAPTHDVAITIAGDAQANVSPNSLTFTTSNWATPQIVTVSAVDDAVIEPPHTGTITHTSSSADQLYDGGFVNDVIAHITDDDNNPPLVEAGDPQTVFLVDGAPWSPTAITPLAWYDAADAGTITESGGSVSQWRDKSGNARNIDQATADLQPGYAASTISFDGTDDYLWNDDPFMYANGQIDVFVVAGITPTTDDRLLSEGSSSAVNPLYCIAQTDNSNASIMSVYIRNNDGGAGGILSGQPNLSATGAIDGNTKLYQWRDTGSAVSGRVNGGAVTTSAYSRSGSLTMDRFSMGAVLRSDAVAHIGADVNEIIICANLSETDRQKMEGYLAHKWGLEVNLPAAHPHRDAAPGGLAAVAVLNGTVSDPDGGTVTQQWSKQAGPATTVAFDDATAVDTNATFTEVGVYTLRLTANDGYESAFDEVAITVADSSTNSFSNWMGGFNNLNGFTAFNDDPDGDGIANGVENYFGTHPGEASRGLEAEGWSGNTFTFSHPLNESPADNISASYRWSKDLTAFHGDGAAFEGTTVAFVQGAPADGIVTVTATITGTPVDRLFVNIEVVEE